MRIYISADIEGVCGVVSWDQTSVGKPEYAAAAAQMTAEVAAACEGALAAGATELVVRDAHGSARNIDPAALPACARLVRGWSGHPFFMMEGIDSSFAAAILIGCHGRAGSSHSPLAHTMSPSKVAEMRLNGRPVSEAVLNAMTAELVGVPVAFVSGDAGVCEEVRQYQAAIATFATQQAMGDSATCGNSSACVQAIREQTAASLVGDLVRCRKPLPATFDLEIEYREAKQAYARSFYPGVKLLSDRRALLHASDYFDVLRAVAFMVC